MSEQQARGRRRGAWRRRCAAGAAGALAALACGGCSWYHAPRLDVTNVHVTEETEEGMVLTFALSATNRNNVALPLKDVRYSLELDGKRVFSGQRSAEATLRRKGTQPIELPAAVAFKEGTVRSVGEVSYELRGELQYVTPGQLAQLMFDTGVRQPTVTFREVGVIVFPAQP